MNLHIDKGISPPSAKELSALRQQADASIALLTKKLDYLLYAFTGVLLVALCAFFTGDSFLSIVIMGVSLLIYLAMRVPLAKRLAVETLNFNALCYTNDSAFLSLVHAVDDRQAVYYYEMVTVGHQRPFTYGECNALRKRIEQAKLHEAVVKPIDVRSLQWQLKNISPAF